MGLGQFGHPPDRFGYMFLCPARTSRRPLQGRPGSLGGPGIRRAWFWAGGAGPPQPFGNNRKENRMHQKYRARLSSVLETRVQRGRRTMQDLFGEGRNGGGWHPQWSSPLVRAWSKLTVIAGGKKGPRQNASYNIVSNIYTCCAPRHNKKIHNIRRVRINRKFECRGMRCALLACVAHARVMKIASSEEISERTTFERRTETRRRLRTFWAAACSESYCYSAQRVCNQMILHETTAKGGRQRQRQEGGGRSHRIRPSSEEDAGGAVEGVGRDRDQRRSVTGHRRRWRRIPGSNARLVAYICGSCSNR